MARIPGLKAKVEVDPSARVPRRIYDIEDEPSRGSPRETAEALLERLAPTLKVDPQQLQFEQVRETILGSQVLFQQHLDGKPVSGAWIRVDLDRDGRVYNIQNDLLPEPTVARKAAVAEETTITAEEAVRRALEASGSSEAALAQGLQPELVYFPYGGVPTLAWKVPVRAENPRADWKIYVDARSGAILEQTNVLKGIDGQGRVFDPNPVITLNDATLQDTSTIPEAAYRAVTLRDLDASGRLDGPFVSTRNTPNRVQRADKQFLFSRSDRAFKEVMVYFHIDRVQRYIQELGFNNILNQAIAVHIDGRSDDNSHYSPFDKALTFGTGGVDDAEDAEIILHEYGHAIQDNQVPGFGAAPEGGAMGEGFGDYLAASFFAEQKPERFRPTIGNWDAVSYSGDDPPSLRRLDSTKKYPRDMVGEEHADGEIWSACLWELRAALGQRTADRLVLAHHFQLTRNAGFVDAANALITVDKVLNEGRNEAAIRDVFVRRGILPNQKRNGKRAGIPFAEICGTNGSGSTRRR